MVGAISINDKDLAQCNLLCGANFIIVKVVITLLVTISWVTDQIINWELSFVVFQLEIDGLEHLSLGFVQQNRLINPKSV